MTRDKGQGTSKSCRVKEIISKLNRQFESRVRLGIMSVLMVNDSVDFVSLKELLDITDGNLASHLYALERNNMIEVRKQFVGRKPNTRYQITDTGRYAFREHLSYLEKLMKNQEKEASSQLSNIVFQAKGASFKAPHFVQYVQKIIEERYGESCN